MKTNIAKLLLLTLLAACAPVDDEDAVVLHDDDAVGDSLADGADGKADGANVPRSLALDKHKIAYLTFDDGPSRAYTPKILDVLKAHHAKATFFITGANIAGNEALLRRERDEGHIVGNHQWQHVKASSATFTGYVTRERELLREVVGEMPQYFRFPYGAGASWKDAILKQEGYIDGGVGWDVDSFDWDFGKDEHSPRAFAPFKDDYEAWVLNQLGKRGGGVILMHDIQWITAKHLDSILTRIEAAGYTFGELPRQRSFIGEACARDVECALADGFCLNGVCTQACSGACPDMAGKTGTRCAILADGEGASQSLCAADCSLQACATGACIDATSPAASPRRVCWSEN